MSSLTGNVRIEPGLSIGGAGRSVLLVIAAAATAAVLSVFGMLGVAAIPAAIAAAAILARPELGLYGLVLALALPIPIRMGSVVLYPHDAVAVLTIVSALIACMRRRSLALPGPWFLVPAACLLVVQILSLINASDLMVSGTEIVQQSYLLILAPVAYYLLLRDERVLRRVAEIFMTLVIAQALLICAQFVLAKFGSRCLIDVFAFGRLTFRGSSRVFGTIGPTVSLLLVASLFFWIDRNVSRATKLFIIALHVFALLATGTRSAMVALFFTFVFHALFARKKAVGLKLMIPALAGFLVFAGAIGLSRFSESLVHATDERSRFPIDKKALKAVPRHPIIGHGPKAASMLSISIMLNLSLLGSVKKAA